MAYVHELSGKKLRSKLGGVLNESVSAPTSSFARNQLKKMGWQEGEGLGRRNQGQSSHIRVSKRTEETSGLGHTPLTVAAHSAGNSWWMQGMGNILTKLSTTDDSSSNNKKKKKKKKKGNAESSKLMMPTDQQLWEATGGARFGMRAQRRQVGKWARTEARPSPADPPQTQPEWNGLGAAKVVIGGLDKNDATPMDKISSETIADEKEEEKKKKKQTKKNDKKKEKKKKRKAKDDNEPEMSITPKTKRRKTSKDDESAAAEEETPSATTVSTTAKKKKKTKKEKKTKNKLKRKGET